MPRPRVLWPLALGLSLLGPVRPARADVIMLPPGQRLVGYTYELRGTADFPETVFVTYPKGCSHTGDPIWLEPSDPRRTAGYLVYDVIEPGHRSGLGRVCRDGSAIHALRRASFTPVQRKGDERWGGAPGLSNDAPYVTLQQLDTCLDQAACESLLRPPRANKLGFRFQPVDVTDETTLLDAVHDVLTVRRASSGELQVVPLTITYTYESGASETLDYMPGGVRPEPVMELERRRSSRREPAESESTRRSARLIPPAPPDDERPQDGPLAAAAAMILAGLAALVVKSQRERTPPA